MPSPSPTMTSAVKLNRRPPFTTLATRLIATTRSRYAVVGAPAPAPRPSPRRSRRPDSPPGPPVPPRRCAPGIRRSLSSHYPSEVQAPFAGRIRERRYAPVVAVAATVEHDGVDAGGLGALRDELADGGRARLLVTRTTADAFVQRGRR